MPSVYTLLGCALVLVVMGATVLVTVLWLDHWRTGRAFRRGRRIRYPGTVYVSVWARYSRPRSRCRTRPVLLHRAGVKR